MKVWQSTISKCLLFYNLLLLKPLYKLIITDRRTGGQKKPLTGCPLIFWTLCFLQFLGLQSTLDNTFGHFCEAHKILISRMSFLKLINIWLKYGPLNVGHLILKSTFYTLICLSIFLWTEIFGTKIINRNTVQILSIFIRIWCKK